MSTRLKSKPVTKIDLASATTAAQSYSRTQRAILKKESDLAAAIQKLKDKHQPGIDDLKELQAEATETLQAYAEQTYNDWEGKSTQLSDVIVGYRTGKKAVVLNEGVSAEDAVENLSEAGLKRFLRVKKELDKIALVKENNEAILNQLAEHGITFGQSETFFVELKKV